MGCLYGMENYSGGWMFMKAVWFVLACFVFSVVFWLTQQAVERAACALKSDKPAKKKGKK